MNIKSMRNVHLYLGVFFTPLVLFFTLTGVLQTFNLHERQDSNPNYKPPQILRMLAQAHKNQRWVDGRSKVPPSQPFRLLIVLMTIGLTITVVLGVVMAFKYTQVWLVWVFLLAGTLIPCLLLGISR